MVQFSGVNSRPYNIDATMFHVTFEDVPESLEIELSKYGPLFSYNDSTFSLISQFFNIQKFKNLNGIQIISEGLPKLRFFKIDNRSMIISPMVYTPIEFDTHFSDPNWESKFSDNPLLYKMLEVWRKNTKMTSDNPACIIQLYDIIGFWLDIELFKEFIQHLRKTNFTFEFRLDELSCLTHYGRELGDKFINIINDDITTSLELMSESHPAVKYEIDGSCIHTDIATLLSIKAACLHQSTSKKPIEKFGLTFQGIKDACNLDPLSMSACIDVLCDNALLKPFNGLETNIRVNRFYNTNIEEFIGIFVKLLKRAENEGIHVGKTNLNKFTVFLNHFVFRFSEKAHGHISIYNAPEGKVIHIKDDDPYIDERLEGLLLNFPEYKDIFEYKKRRYKVKKDAFKSKPDYMKHMTIVEELKLYDAYIDILFDVYHKLENYLSNHTEIVNTKGYRRDIYDVFPGFIELIGKEYPAGGLEIVGNLTKDALFKYKRSMCSTTKQHIYGKKAHNLLFDSIPHKIDMYKIFSEAYFECYKYLAVPGHSIKSLVWQRICVYPSSSLILELCNKIILFIRNNLKPDTEMSAVGEKVERFLDLLIGISSSMQVPIPEFSKDDRGSYYIASVDLRNSTEVGKQYDERWATTERFLINIMLWWAKIHNGKVINKMGDGILAAFPDLSSARAFAAGCCTHLNEITENINRCKTFENIEIGCRGKIVYGCVDVDPNKNCYSSEINEMEKELPKTLIGKIIIDGKSIKVNTVFSESKVVENKRPYVIIEPIVEFKKMILSQFEQGQGVYG